MDSATTNAVATTVARASAPGVGGFATGMVSVRARQAAMASASAVATSGTSVVKAAAAGHLSFAGVNAAHIPAWVPLPRRAPL